MIRSPRSASLSTRRIEAFTDGVFAIAATLLVLDLTDHSLGEVDSEAQMWAALGDMSNLFFNFALSFVLLCLLWRVHVQQFEHVQRVDTTVIWLNNARLLFIVLVPFATNLTTEYSEFVAGRLAMPVSFFLAILCSGLQWEWMARHADVMLPEMTTADVVAFGRASRSALIISAVVVAPAPWVGSWAFLPVPPRRRLHSGTAPQGRLIRGGCRRGECRRGDQYSLGTASTHSAPRVLTRRR
ncbi:TMEM175 family protein [Microbacterium sp. zg.Y625]|uniref:TMEM175 family protein n=1 Tax=Microbacterium jiangjiandongii TaxID=3049071 RepID=UPI00214B0010|nr:MULTISPECIES: TMEM175 family protein [unclassified Microbacterium]MCR2793592.1 TMEM175 family protein [Microbacterium sp. zg.Y625]WIM25944.1 TMEM175 family protein [Microbacterium sp. zg-Y625]